MRFVGLARLGSRFGFAYLSPGAIDPQQGEQPSQRPVKLLQSFGFRSSPKVVGSQGLLLAPRAGPTNGIAIAVDNFSVGPIDLNEGDAVMYGAGGSTLWHRADGSVTLDSASAKDVTVNGGTLKVARATDLCEIVTGPMATWMAQVEGFINGVVPNTVSPLSTAFLHAPGIRIASTQGSPRFKA